MEPNTPREEQKPEPIPTQQDHGEDRPPSEGGSGGQPTEAPGAGFPRRE
jgi:hypothetical protein